MAEDRRGGRNVMEDGAPAGSSPGITRGRFLALAGAAVVATLAEALWTHSAAQPALAQASQGYPLPRHAQPNQHFAVLKTDAEWRKILAPEEYYILRQQGTEPAFHNAYWNNHQKGTYACAGCGQVLFSSDTKFDSGTGWPSFWAPVAPDRVLLRSDHSYDMDRTEVICSRCGGHLGHVFNDGPRPTGLRYCMDSAALRFTPAKPQADGR